MQEKEIAHFINDESFLSYCTGHNQRDVKYWHQWLHDHPEHVQEVESLRQLVLLMATNAREHQMEQNFAELNNRIHHQTTSRPLRSLWPRITAVAASVIFIISMGLYFLTQQKKTSTLSDLKPGVFKNEVLPGNKAILTLGNGKQLAVNNLPSGRVANTGIQKNSTGELIYANTDAAPDELNILTVPNGGGKHDLKLADGTLVTVDAGSSITFPVAFNGKDRKVKITGQVYFEVTHNARKPFLVSVAGQTIEDLGTRFNVNSFDGMVRTTLIEGSVKAGGKLIKPGQQAVQPVNGQPGIVNEIDTAAVMAWKNGLFNFNHTELTAAMKELARWYDITVIYEGPDKPYYFGGYLDRNGKLTSTLKILQNNGLKFSLDGKKLIVYR